MHHEVVLLEDEGRLAVEAAATVVDRATRAVAARGAFSCALAGGTTPRATYRLLADLVPVPPLDRTTLLFTDERCVPASDPESNFRMVGETLLDRLPPNVHPRVLRMEGEREDRDAAARDYERLLRQAVSGDPAHPGGPPIVDLVLLGIGTDGHTASLFPESPLFGRRDDRIVAAVYAEALRSWRITLTARTITAARERVFLVDNPAKKLVVAAALASGSSLPAGRVGRARWLLAPAKIYRDVLPEGVREVPPVS